MNRSPRSPERILERLDWTVIRRLDGVMQGDYRTFFQGLGLDLADIREYQFADDVRSIDWNVTARMQEPHVRRYVEDRELTAWFLLDISPSQDFGTARALKRDLLVDFTAVLARLLTRRGNRVGAITFDGNPPRLRPAAGGRLQVLQIVSDLIDQPRPRRAPQTDISVLLNTAGRVIRRRSLVFVVSDFFSAPGWARPLGRLGRRHEVLGVRLHDAREAELPDLGPVWFEDSETGEQLYLDTHDRRFRQRFAQAARQRELELNEAFRSSGMDLLSLSTDDDLVKSLLRFAERRRRRKAMPAAFARGGTR